MKSFKNHFNGHKFLPLLQNTSFESPSLTTNSFIYHNILNQKSEKFYHMGRGEGGGGNAINNSGPFFINGDFA